MKLTKFDFKEHNLTRKVIATIGERGSGKGWNIREMKFNLDEEQMVPFNLTCSKTEGATQQYGKYSPDLYIFNGPNDDKIKEIIERGETINGSMNDARKIAIKLFKEYATDDELDELNKYIDMDSYKKTENCDKLLLEKLSLYWVSLPEETKQKLAPFIYVDPRSYIVYDDCIADEKAFKSKEISDVFLNGRHYGITFIFAMQAPKKITTDLRSNVDYVFIYGGGDLKKIHEAFLQDKIEFKQFQKIMKHIAVNYRCLVIHRTSHKPIEESIWWYKAEDKSGIQMGSEMSKKYHKIYYDKNYKERKKMNTLDNQFAKNIISV